MYGYTKLFGSIVSSTVWQEDLPTKVVWITLLAMSDKDGTVEGSIPGLAHHAGVTLDECERALDNLQKPDKYSRTPDHEGRRIEVVDGGWFILNRAKYRDLIPEERRRERDRIRQERRRRKQRTGDVTQSRVTERDSHDLSHQKEKETEKETETRAKPTPSTQASPERVEGAPVERKAPQARLTVLASTVYAEYPRKVAKDDALKATAKAIVKIASEGATEQHADFHGDHQAAAAWLKERVHLYSGSPQGRRLDKDKIPYPATWMNKGRYSDDPREWEHAGEVIQRPSNSNGSRSAGAGSSEQTDYTGDLEQQLDGSYRRKVTVTRSAVKSTFSERNAREVCR